MLQARFYDYSLHFYCNGRILLCTVRQLGILFVVFLLL